MKIYEWFYVGVFTFQNEGIYTIKKNLVTVYPGVFTFQNEGIHTMSIRLFCKGQVFLPPKMKAFDANKYNETDFTL